VGQGPGGSLIEFLCSQIYNFWDHLLVPIEGKGLLTASALGFGLHQ